MRSSQHCHWRAPLQRTDPRLGDAFPVPRLGPCKELTRQHPDPRAEKGTRYSLKVVLTVKPAL